MAFSLVEQHTFNKDIITKIPEIDKLNTRMNMSDIEEVMAYICKSSKDISIFFGVLNYINKDNLILKPTTKLHELIQKRMKVTFPKRRISNMLADMIKVDFVIKLGNGKHFINPMIATGKNQASKEIEIVQSQWKVYKNIGKYTDRNELTLLMQSSSPSIRDIRLSPELIVWIDNYNKKGYKPSHKTTNKSLKSTTFPIVETENNQLDNKASEDTYASKEDIKEPSDEAKRAFK